MSQLVPTWQPGFQPARRGRSRSHGRREGGLLKPGGWSFVKTGGSKEVEGIRGMCLWRFEDIYIKIVQMMIWNDILNHQIFIKHRGKPPPQNNLIRFSTSILRIFWWNMQEIYGLHAIPSSLGFAISNLPPFRQAQKARKKMEARKANGRTKPGKQGGRKHCFFLGSPSCIFFVPVSTTNHKTHQKNHEQKS